MLVVNDVWQMYDRGKSIDVGIDIGQFKIKPSRISQVDQKHFCVKPFSIVSAKAKISETLIKLQLT